MGLIPNADEIHAQVIEPALAHLDSATIPALQKAEDEVADRAATQLSNLIAAALQGIQATADKAASDLREILTGLDGWTVEIGPIAIPSVVIRLRSPK